MTAYSGYICTPSNNAGISAKYYIIDDGTTAVFDAKTSFFASGSGIASNQTSGTGDSHFPYAPILFTTTDAVNYSLTLSINIPASYAGGAGVAVGGAVLDGNIVETSQFYNSSFFETISGTLPAGKHSFAFETGA